MSWFPHHFTLLGIQYIFSKKKVNKMEIFYLVHSSDGLNLMMFGVIPGVTRGVSPGDVQVRIQFWG